MSRLPKVGETIVLEVTQAQDAAFEQGQKGDRYEGKVLSVNRTGFIVEFVDEADRENWGDEVEFVWGCGVWVEVDTVGMLGWNWTGKGE